MKKTGKEEVIKYRINRANESLRESDNLFSNEFLFATINRLYYSCYYAVTALLIKNDIEVKSHAGVRQMFGKHFIVTGRISKEYGKFYSDLFNYRQDNDYRDLLVPERELVIDLLKKARSFIIDVLKEIEK
jgi:uncharacterized protein (UPF0332 family)